MRVDRADVTQVRRYDVGTLGEQERTPQGGFKIPAFPTRVGVFPYMMPDGTMRKEWRPPEEVLDPASLASLVHAPVTDLHPEREGVSILVTPENYRDLTVGHAGADVRAEGDHVAVTLWVQDATEILKIESGQRRELSCGYVCDLDPTPGVTPSGEIYDAIQRRIRYNHIALGPEGWGRAGPTVRLRIDGGDGVQQGQDQGKEAPVEKEIIDGKEYVVGSAEWRTAKNAQIQALQGRADAAERTAKSEKDRADKAEKDLKDAKDPQVVQRRVKLVLDCKRVAAHVGKRLDDELAAASTEQDLIVQAIQQLDPSFDPSGKTPEYLAGYFASLIKSLGAAAPAEETTTTEGALDQQGGTTTTQPTKTDGKGGKRSIFDARQGEGQRQDNGNDGGSGDKDPDPDAARDAMIKRQRERGRAPLGARN